MFKTPAFLPLVYPSLIWKIATTEKVIYLTFDDGPIPEITEKVLDILKSFNAKATFFCIGDNVRKYPKIFKRIILEKHAVGNHTFNHLNGWKTTSNTYLKNTEKCSEILSINGVKSQLFRPPYGRVTPKQIKTLTPNYQLIMWSVLSKDYNPKIDKEACLENTVKHTKNGSIVVFHDSLKASENMLYVLPKFLEIFTAKGYRFDVLTAALQMKEY